MSIPSRLPSFPSREKELRTPAKHALYIAEVLAMILDELVNDKRSLSHLAFTCKAIADPALDLLWALNDSLEPFIALLPEELRLNEESCIEFDALAGSRLSPTKWVNFDKYARRARRLYARTVTMNPHRVHSSIYQQLSTLRPNVELFPNLTSLVFHAKNFQPIDLRMFPSSLRFLTLSWSNVMSGEHESTIWSSIMTRLFHDAPLIEKIHFEGSPRDPVHTLIPLPFEHLREVRIKSSPIFPNVLHTYCHALSASTIRELDLRFIRWPDPRLQPISPVFPSLKKLTVDGSPSRAMDFIQRLSSPRLEELVISLQSDRGGEPIAHYAQLLTLLAKKYQGIFRKLDIQYSLLCENQAELELFLHALRALVGSGLNELHLYLIVGWPELTQEVQEMIDPSRWTALGHFTILSRRARTPWSW
ncbi:hypothetical protein PAXINDRAFT_167902 [Paxillus involutus ATCC 200175]|nr:hypothetical protein PAXINDRAFT_167902 [Paxillus involutus ATCC 200175]